MAGIFSFLKCIDTNSIITTPFCSLNSKYSALLLLVCSVLVAWRQQFGTAIDCIARDDIPTAFINDYCYIHSTYSFEESWNKSVGVDILYPGVDKYRPEATKVVHTYYQWVSLLLFLQSILFFIPDGFWKRMEAGKLRKLASGFRFGSTNEEGQQKNVEEAVQGFLIDSRSNRGYFFNYCVADVLKLLNVVGQIGLMDVFLGGGFFTYGSKMFQFSWNPTDHLDPKAIVFPKMAQCDYYTYGRTGDVQRHDFLCLLPLNALNEKIYALLWFWFFLLAVLSGLAVLVDLLFLVSRTLRSKMLSKGMHFAERCAVENIVGRCHCGDWFAILLLRRNIVPLRFSEFVSCLALELSPRKRDVERQSSEERRELYKFPKLFAKVNDRDREC